MKKKSILIVALICVLLLVVGTFAYKEYFSQPKIKVGDTYFTIPDGYEESSLNKLGDKSLSNGLYSLYLRETNDSSITNTIAGYVSNYNGTQNVSITNFTAGNIVVYKSSLSNESNNKHYWFVYADKIYTIYTWDGNENTDMAVLNIVKTAEK